MKYVIEQEDSGTFYLTSPDVKGLLAMGDTEAEAIADVPDAMAEIVESMQARLIETTQGRDFLKNTLIEIGQYLALRSDITPNVSEPISEKIASALARLEAGELSK